MEPLKPRDKVTQHMTRDGLTLDNQTTGESVNVSSREAEQEYTAQPEGAAEKILERADKLEAAKEALPKKRVVTKETVYDEAKGKAKSDGPAVAVVGDSLAVGVGIPVWAERKGEALSTERVRISARSANP